MSRTQVRTRLLEGFDDPSFRPEQWTGLLHRSDSDVVFLTYGWQRTWWESFGRGRLLLIVAEQDGRDVALAPLFSEAAMIYFVGSGGSDYLDFVGDISSSPVLDALLSAAREHVPGFLGFVFYHVPERSQTGARLWGAAKRIGLSCFDEGTLPAPAMLLDGEVGRTAVGKKSLVRHENFFRREGELEILHLRDGQDILPHLDEFFEQHMDRWAGTSYPSLFNDVAQRRFYQSLCCVVADTDWLRFTRVNWKGRPIAFHFGFCYRGNYLWYKPSFAIALARWSPGEVLLRQLLSAAMAEGATLFDFGLGDEPFKQRFATHVNYVHSWGLYPATDCAAG